MSASPGRPAPVLSAEGFRQHPGLRAAIEAYAAASLGRYRAAAPIERWMVSDMGRSSLSGTISVLDGMGRLTPGAFLTSRPVASGEVSQGRARLYLQRLLAHDLLVAEGAEPLTRETRLRPSARFEAVMAGLLQVGLEATAMLAPDVTPGLARLPHDPRFVARAKAELGRLLVSRQDLFPLDAPVRLFQDRDGGSQMLEELILRQRPGRERLLEDCKVNRSALARSSFCSRAHVNQLIRDGEAKGLLTLSGGSLQASLELSVDVERYFAAFFYVAGESVSRALAACEARQPS